MSKNNSLETVSINLSIELDGLDNEIDLGAGSTLVFDFIPSDVVVYFSLDSNTNSRIKAKQGLEIEAEHGKVYLWSVGVNETEQMELIHWGGDDIKIIMPPRSDFESLNGYGALALIQLDKIANPYIFNGTSNGTSNGTTLTTLLSKTLTCNKLDVSLFFSQDASSNRVYVRGAISLFINGQLVGISGGYNDGSGFICTTFKKEIRVNIGDTLEVKAISSSSADFLHYSIEEYTLKA